MSEPVLILENQSSGHQRNGSKYQRVEEAGYYMPGGYVSALATAGIK